MGRYSGTLHKLIESACNSDSKKKWDQVLFYLEGHTISNAKIAKPPVFESPLAPSMIPSVELECELFDQQCSKKGKKEDTPLKIAVKGAPANVIAALCHLGPEVSRMVDSRERLPIHVACRRSSEDPQTEKVLMVLAKCNPESMLHRDDCGRTPLHWLFWFHARSRSPTIVRFFCQEIPYDLFLDIRQPHVASNEQNPLPEIPHPNEKEEIPQSAAIVHDSCHGAIPLHYAVMQGASKDAVRALIDDYPGSTAVGDRKGRTTLAWYLGAGSLMERKKTNVCGEINDSNVTLWWHTRLSVQLIQLLVSSKAARMVDRDTRRTPLHWACYFFARSTTSGSDTVVHSQVGPSISNKIFQIILDHNIEAVTFQDNNGETPLHVMFSAVAEIQDMERKRFSNLNNRPQEINITLGGPVAFNPPKQLVGLLLKCPDTDGLDIGHSYNDKGQPLVSAASLENNLGFLPLHTALHVATSSQCIQLLIQSHPTGLVHTSEVQMQTPLIQAFSSAFSSPLQPLSNLKLLLAAYPTSRHGTFMDGRLAIKMEDALGKYPIHYACQNQASFECLKLFVEKFNHCATYQNADGDLPIHSMLSQDNLFSCRKSGRIVRGASLAKPLGLLTEQEKEWQKEVTQVQKLKMRILLEPLKLPEHLKVASFSHGMNPLHIAVAFEVVPYDRLFRLLETYPEANRMRTTEESHEYSCIQLHDRLEKETEDQQQWQAIKELLYSFNPLVDSHRREEELLDACVRLVRKEITGQGSYHMKQLKGSCKSPESIDLNETLSTINSPIIENIGRSKNRRQTNVIRQTHKRNENGIKAEIPIGSSSSFASMIANKLGRNEKQDVKKSIYDADLDDRYIVSPHDSIDDEDEDVNELDDISASSDEEEYYSEDDSMTDGGMFSENLGRESVSQTLSQTLSYVHAGSYISDKSLLRRAIADRAIDDHKAVDGSKTDYHILDEKKEDTSATSLDTGEIIELSHVGRRLWCFFVAYNNYKCPEDNYLQQVESILQDLEFDIVEQLIDLALPEYAVEYMKPGVSPVGLTMRDIASPKVNELFESYHFFLGSFEFSSEIDGVLLHRSCDDNTVFIRATEHVVRTTEYQHPKTFGPGLAEEKIWNTGEMAHDEEGYLASKFKDKKRQVCFKFTRSQTVYDNEVRSRSQLGMKVGDISTNNILPIIGHFNASQNGRYRLDSNDERFKIIHCYGGESICLSDYPYALVYPHSDEGDLYEYFYHQGVHQKKEIADIGIRVARALKLMHDKNVVHRNLSMRCITMLPFDNEVQNPQRIWAVSNFSGACCNFGETGYMGAISQDGSTQFETGLLPPEMFTKVSSSEEEIYRAYWRKVEELFNVQVDWRVKEPYVDITTGCSYVIRCHYVINKARKTKVGGLPELPYKLVQARESTDLWCLGLLLFTLCSGGRQLFPINVKSGHLLDHHGIVNWDMDAARANIYEHVGDHIAQDLLFLLLLPFEDRNMYLTMDSVISHPYFSSSNESELRNKVITKHENESFTYMRKRSKEVIAKSEDDWLGARTVRVNCWNFDMLQTFHFSSSEIVRRLIGKTNSMPSAFLLLPYKLSAKNKKSKLAPTTKKDVERAESMGVLLLSLAKTLSFGSCVEVVIENSRKGKKWDATTLLEAITFFSDQYGDLKEEFSNIAADRIEAFRIDPFSAVIKLVERRYLEIRKLFKDARKAFLYLVDEHIGVPLVGAAYAPYPLEISESNMDNVLSRILPFMHSCSMVVRGTSGSISGIVRLIFEAAFPHVPPSWSQAGSGLTHELDEDLIKREIVILHRTLSGLNSSRTRRSLGDDLSAIKSICTKMDVRGDYANLYRVQCADSSLWTSSDGIKLIREACNNYDFKQAIKIQIALETKLKSQEHLIKDLQEKIERMAWQKELNLNVPETNSTAEQLLIKKQAVKETISYAPSTIVEGSPPKSDEVEITTNHLSSTTSITTKDTKSTFRDQISVD